MMLPLCIIVFIMRHLNMIKKLLLSAMLVGFMGILSCGGTEPTEPANAEEFVKLLEKLSGQMDNVGSAQALAAATKSSDLLKNAAILRTSDKRNILQLLAQAKADANVIK